MEVIPTAETFDVVVIGGGRAGTRRRCTAGRPACRSPWSSGAGSGGTCLNVGCIPAKELLETAAIRRAVVGAAAFGVNTSEPTMDFAVTQQRKQKVVDQLVGGLATLLKRRKVTIFDGVGTLGAGHVVTVGGGQSGDVELLGEAVVIASGSVPRTIPGLRPRRRGAGADLRRAAVASRCPPPPWSSEAEPSAASSRR